MMGQINGLSESFDQQYGGQVRVNSYNTRYDDTDEVNHLIEHIVRESIILPAVFIEDELILAGSVDESSISHFLNNRILGKV